jgi:5'-deoxynucleotidase YfbR-like HD superfamily hydrolase
MKNKINKSLDGAYKFMAAAYHGNWQFRWSETPYLVIAIKAGKRESIVGHEWACIGFWFYLSRICPALSALVDKAEIYERLWSHDLGETFYGDISQVTQIKGGGKNKHIMERREMARMGKSVPKAIFQPVLEWFDEFESQFEKINKVEVLVVKFIDTIEGNHFAFSFGRGFSKHKNTVRKVVERSFVPVTRQLLKVLSRRGAKKAHAEVQAVAKHHLAMIKRVGVSINPEFLSQK